MDKYSTRAAAQEVMRLMREDFDPHPNYELPAGSWDDNAEDVADQIVAAVLSATREEVLEEVKAAYLAGRASWIPASILADEARTERDWQKYLAARPRRPSQSPNRRASDATIADLVKALEALHHAVCGETGFASAVRGVSGLAYPWPALDEADELARAALLKVRGEQL